MNNQSTSQLKIKAIYSLRPNSEWVWRGEDYSGIEWLDESQTKPSEEEIYQEAERLQLEYRNLEYQRQRAPEYPDLKELADALYWNSQGDTSKLEEYYSKCEEVKNKYPKPQ
jgi:hypothetical protein